MHHAPAAEISMEHGWLKPLVEFGSKREKSCAPPTDEPMSPFLIFLLLTP